MGIFAPLLSVTKGIMLAFLSVHRINYQAADHTSSLEPRNPHRQRQAVAACERGGVYKQRANVWD